MYSVGAGGLPGSAGGGALGVSSGAGGSGGLGGTGGLGGVDGDVSALPGAAQPRGAAPLATLGSLTPPPIAPRIEPEMPRAPVIKLPKKAQIVVDEDDDESPAPRRAKRKSEARASETPEPPKAKSSQSRMGVWVMCAVAGVVFAVGARISQDRRATSASAPPPAAAAAAAAPATSTAQPAPASSQAPQAASTSAPAAPPAITVPGDTESDPLLPQEAPLRSDEKVPKGQGLLEVVVGPADKVSIDGQPTVAGPVVKATLAPREKPYEIKVKMKAEERVKFALVKEGKRTRVRVAPPWNH